MFATRSRVPAASCRTPSTSLIIAKVEADSNPIIYIAVEAGSLSTLEASDYVKRYIQPRLSVLPGAADVRVFGERRVSMRINLDRTRLAGYKLTVQDVEDAIRRQNAEIPAGRIESTARGIHRGGRNRCEHAGAVRQHHRRQRFGSLSGSHPRRRQHCDRRGRRAHGVALQRQAVAQHRRDQAGSRQSARALATQCAPRSIR